ncbi:hypothetical protein EYC80_007052 [Monilinia laxa]|uniref:ABC transmembrane type-1 domain-containing protein n=1 Tax=Monilinia laxa TaxID=61186 RepID=A0A5N6K019_MONLA|nr:hypothetical protein EYC80_007052 [Monilinia laxa]
MKEERGARELVRAVSPTLEDEDITSMGYKATSIMDKQLRLRIIFWRFSTSSDKIFQIVAVLAVIGAGTTRPLMAMVFGSLVHDFNRSAIITLFSGFFTIPHFETPAEGRTSLIYSDAAALLEEVFSSIQTVMTMGAEPKLLERYNSYLEKLKTSKLKRSLISGVKLALSYFALLSAYALAFCGNVVIVILCVNMSTHALRQLLPSWTMLAKATSSARNSGKFPDEISGRIELREVRFAYPSKPSIETLSDVSIVLERGKTTAITGFSGSGKSTIIGPLERNYDVSSGEILLDGENVKDLNIGWLRNQIGLVQQEPILFNDSIFQNVANGLHNHRASTLTQVQTSELAHQACTCAGYSRVIEEGTHAALFNQGGIYQSLVKAQDLKSPDMEESGTEGFDGSVPPIPDVVTQMTCDEKAPMNTARTEISALPPIESGATSQQRTLIRCLGLIMRDLKHYRPLFIIGTLTCIISGGIYPSQSIVFANSVTVFEFHGGLLKHNGTFWALMWFILALGVCLDFGTMGTIFSAIAAIVGQHYRNSYFAAILAQDASFFATNDHSPGSLTAQLTSRT